MPALSLRRYGRRARAASAVAGSERSEGVQGESLEQSAVAEDLSEAVVGGLTTKLHALVDGRGRPLVVHVGPGHANDSRC